VGILKESEAHLDTGKPCRTHGIGQQTFYRWKTKYGGLLEVSDAHRLQRGLPERTAISHGTEFTSNVLDQCSYQNKVALHFIPQGRPMESGHVQISPAPHYGRKSG
jgi:hypothetical protein